MRPTSTVRIALANLRIPANPEESVALAEEAIAEASALKASLIAFPECFVPGYRASGKPMPPPDPIFLGEASSALAAACAKAGVAAALASMSSPELRTLGPSAETIAKYATARLSVSCGGTRKRHGLRPKT